MKKLIYLIFAFGFVSCSLSEDETEKLHKINHQRETERITRHFTKVEYEGHSYIYFEKKSGSFSYAGLTHDPDCHCLYSITD